jgi:DNA-binding MarR family transcriptional regulator
MARTVDAAQAALEYLRLYPNVYLRFHRRDPKHSEMSGASRGVLLHLAQSGPLSVGDCAKHLKRAQSVVSEIVDQLERNGLLARVRDDRDKRRTLVWLTDEGRARLVAEQEVLSSEAIERAFYRMKPQERRMLLEGTTALIRAADQEFALTAVSPKVTASKRNASGPKSS